MRQDYDNGKYTVIFNERTGAMHALRHGEPWQDMSGNNLVYWMLVEHTRALERIAELEKDAARLDWLESSKEMHAFCHTGYDEYRYYAHQADGFQSVRDTIDTAMQKD